jgi:hypothetical protein
MSTSVNPTASRKSPRGTLTNFAPCWAVDINNGERVIVARQIEFRELKKSEMKVPSSGQKVTQAEFRKIVDETMKQMGGRGGMIIRN